MSELCVGPFTLAPGSKLAAVHTIQAAGHAIEMPLFLINGAQDGPTVVITGGIHGAEYASIEAALRVGRALQAGKLRGKVIVAPIANMTAFKARSIYVCPLDGKNLNRMFPGNAEGSASEQIAHWLFETLIRHADYYVDLHGGDLVEALVPFTIYHGSGNEDVDARSVELARVFGIRYIVRSETVGGTYSAASRAGIPAMLAESGGQGIWPPKAVKLLTDGVDRLLRHLGMVAGTPPKELPTQVLGRFPWLRSEHDGFFYPQVAVGQAVTEGERVGIVTDYQGNVLQTAVSPVAGEVLFLVSSLAINKGDPLLAVGA